MNRADLRDAARDATMLGIDDQLSGRRARSGDAVMAAAVKGLHNISPRERGTIIGSYREGYRG
jgi:hypothetical protein